MITILICYYSKSGNTERMAREIRDGIRESESQIDVDLKRVDEVEIGNLPNYDGLILGSPTYYGLPAAEIKEFIDKSVCHHGNLEGVVGGAFASSANPGGGNETTVIAIIEALLIHGMIVKGTSKGDHYAPVAIGEPSEVELRQCRNYGKWMADFTYKIRSES